MTKYVHSVGVAALACWMMLACTPGPRSSAVPAYAQSISVIISPGAASVSPGGTVTLSAAVGGASNDEVTWSITEGTVGGTVDRSGVYVAPAAQGVYHVVATSVADPKSSATAVITVATQLREILVIPAEATVAPGAKLQLTVNPQDAGGDLVWSIDEGLTGGNITATGLYEAPSTPGTYHVSVVAMSAQVESAASGTATKSRGKSKITVAPVTVAVSPSTTSITIGGTQTFSCAITGSTDFACNWSVQEGSSGGAITAAGFYTAPQLPGTYHVIAQSHADPSRSAMATVAVTVPSQPLAVSIVPGSAAVDACETVAFQASMAGSSNTAVTWAVMEEPEGGSISASGIYTAPAIGGTYHVVATSQADATISQTAVVTVTERILSVSVSPNPVVVEPNATIQFTATVTTTCGAFTQ